MENIVETRVIVRILFFLALSILTTLGHSQQTNMPNPRPSYPPSSLEALKKKVESLHKDLNRTLKRHKTNNDAIKQQVDQTAKEADSILTDLDIAIKNYDQQDQTDPTVLAQWQAFEQNVFLKISNFQDLMHALQQILIKNKEQEQTGLRTASIIKQTHRTHPVKRQQRRKKTSDKALLKTFNDDNEDKQGPKIRYSYTKSDASNNPNEEPFLN